MPTEAPTWEETTEIPTEPTWDNTSSVEAVPTWDETKPVESEPAAIRYDPEIPRDALDLGVANEKMFQAGLPRPAVIPEKLFGLTTPLAEIPRVSAQMLSDAGDTIAAFQAHLMTGGKVNATEVLGGRSSPPSTEAKLLAGEMNVASGAANFMLTPLGIATMGMGAFPKIVQRLVALGFAADMVSQLPEASRIAGEASVTGDAQEKVEAYGNAGVNALFAALSAKHGLAPGTPIPATKQQEVITDLRKILEDPKSFTPKEDVAPNPIVENLKAANAPLTAQAVEQKLSSPAPVEAPKTRAEGQPEAVSSEAGTNQSRDAQAQTINPATTEATKTQVVGEETMAGPGGTIPVDVGKANSEIAQLASSIPEIRTVRKTAGKSIATAAAESKTAIADGLTATKDVFNSIKSKLSEPPKFDDMDRAIGEWSRELQESSRDAYLAWKQVQKQIPDETRRGAIGAYVDAGGDMAMIQKAAETLPGKYGETYREALKLSKDEKTFAQSINNYFESRLKDAQEAGIMEDGLENYIRRIYEKESGFKTALLSANKLSTATPDFARKRVFGTDAEAIAAGYKPIQDFAQRVLTYDQELNRAIADRSFVKKLMARTMPDGRPMIDVGGMGVEIPRGAPDALLIKPQFKPGDTSPVANRSDYKPFNHAALRKWKWVGEADGKPIMLQGDVLIHPDALTQVKKLLEPSAIRANPIGRIALKLSSTMKQTMLDLSGFHQVQIGVHALEHRVVPSKRFGNLVEIDLKEPTQKSLVEHGLIISEEGAFSAFGEGLHGNSLLGKVPLLGKQATAYHDWLFKEYIPTIKMTMATKALERNRHVYPKLLEDQVMRLTAEQANAAFGGLNYKMLGRSQTMQDFLRLAFLAPDFLEARGRFAGQAAKPFGREQLTALAIGAATLYVTARIINQAIDDNPHWEPENAFNIIHDKHAYGLRTVQGDILHLMSKPGQFWYHRFNPFYVRPMIELSTGRDYFGNKVSLGDVALNQLKSYVPISLRGMFEGKDQNVFESALNAFGVTTRRFSSITKVYDLADKWKKENNVRVSPGEFIYNPKEDPLHDLKTALQYEDSDNAVKEVEKLLASKQFTKSKLREHFRRYADSPFTGSAANDRKFKATLNAGDAELLREATEAKKKVNQDFIAALNLIQTNGTPASK